MSLGVVGWHYTLLHCVKKGQGAYRIYFRVSYKVPRHQFDSIALFMWSPSMGTAPWLANIWPLVGALGVG